MKTNFLGPLRDVQLGTLALAIALGWSLYQTAAGVATFVETWVASGTSGWAGYVSAQTLGLTWVWHHHVFTFNQLVLGLIEFGTVLLVAAYVRRDSRAG
jgi:hypothetical protein